MSKLKLWGSRRHLPRPSRRHDRHRAHRPFRTRPSPPSSACKLQLDCDRIEEAILEAEAQVERLEGEAADPLLTSDHKRAATVYCQLKDGQSRVTDLYARWAELDAMRSGG